MKQKLNRLFSGVLSALMMLTLFAAAPIDVQAIQSQAIYPNDDPFVVVSMGDSFSAGEGIEPFYGQDLPLTEKIKNHDWLAHRSELSWGGQIIVPSSYGDEEPILLRDHRKTGKSDADVQWYFTAVTGAKTTHIDEEKQGMDFAKAEVINGQSLLYAGEEPMPLQIDIFDQIDEDVQVDYVTISIGGNDAGFTKIITDCVVFNANIFGGKISMLEHDLNKVWGTLPEIKEDLTRVFKAIEEKAGEDATILVAGYPHLLAEFTNAHIDSREVALVNGKITDFNNEIEKLTEELRAQGMNIHFVSVEEAFDGHEAYTADPYLNEIFLSDQPQEVNESNLASAYSIHPNAKGAEAYAKCINAKIAELERAKQSGTLCGRIVKDTDPTAPIPGAKIFIVDDADYMRQYEITPDEQGYFSIDLQPGNYSVSIEAEGCMPMGIMAQVEDLKVIDVTVRLLSKSNENQSNPICGVVVDHHQRCIEEARVELFRGWNYDSFAEWSDYAMLSEEDGEFRFDQLPAGYYTLRVSMDGYKPYLYRFIVRGGNIPLAMYYIQMEPLRYTAKLTWDESPADLDAHMYANGLENFHVSHVISGAYGKYGVECSLDTNDTDGFGPENITLLAMDGTTFTYYVHQNSDGGTLAASGAKVELYYGDELIETYRVPTDQGDRRWWCVFSICDDEVRNINELHDNTPEEPWQ